MTTFVEFDENWLDLTSDQSLIVSESYTVQNHGSFQVYLYESSSTPPADDTGLILNQFESAILKQDTDNFYLKSSGDTGKVVVNISS